MGMQSSSVNELGLTNLSTTFLTGTLTGLVSSVVRPGGNTTGGTRRLSVLIGLAAGALLSGLLVATAPRVVPVLPLTAVITVLVLSAVSLRNGKHAALSGIARWVRRIGTEVTGGN